MSRRCESRSSSRGQGQIPAGLVSDALVEAVDIAPTLLEAAGLPMAPGMQGRSLWPLLAGGQDLNRHRDDIYSEYYNASVMFSDPDPLAFLTMVRTERYISWWSSMGWTPASCTTCSWTQARRRIAGATRSTER